MTQLDDRLRRAATSLQQAVDQLPRPAENVVGKPTHRREWVAATLATCAVLVVIAATFLFANLGDDSASVKPGSPGASGSTLPPLLPPGLRLPSDWRVAAGGTTTAVIRGTGPVDRIVVWRPTVVADPSSSDLVAAPYAIGGYFFGHPDLDVTSETPVGHLGGRKVSRALVTVRAAAPACGARHCVTLTVDGDRRLSLTSGHAVQAYFGTAYGQPLVVFVESTTNSLTNALAAARPVLRQLRWGAVTPP
ncbi:MAG: hypothetical protein QOJ03_1467 [Frankiaceae bacterium]|jgi:hypothetical protein|nr:hypothetical protein [Frankiaceae bacterium]